MEAQEEESKSDSEPDWEQFGMEENPDDLMARIRSLPMIDETNVGDHLQDFKDALPRVLEQTKEDLIFREIDAETIKRIKKATEPFVQEHPDLVKYGPYKHREIGHEVPYDANDPSAGNQWIPHRPGSSMSVSDALQAQTETTEQRIRDGEISKKDAKQEAKINLKFNVFKMCNTTRSSCAEIGTALLSCCMKCKAMVTSDEVIPQLSALDPSMPEIPVHLKDKSVILQPSFVIPDGYKMNQICRECFSALLNNKDETGRPSILSVSAFRSFRDMAKAKIYNYGIAHTTHINSEALRGFAWHVHRTNLQEMNYPDFYLSEGRTPKVYEKLMREEGERAKERGRAPKRKGKGKGGQTG